MRVSKKSGYAAILDVLSEPLADIGPIESILEDTCVTLADRGCGIVLPGNLLEYRYFIDKHRI